MRPATAFLIILILAGCQTVESGASEPAADKAPVASPAETDMISAAAADAMDDHRPPASPKPQEAGAKPATGGGMPEAAAEPDDGKRYTLGATTDPDVREAAYQALAEQVSKTRMLENGSEDTTELGDADGFKYTVLRLLRGRDDVSGGQPEAADGMDLAVTGWYKRTVTDTASSARSTCTSFDATVSLVRRDGDWRLADGTTPQLGRENNEDCY